MLRSSALLVNGNPKLNRKDIHEITVTEMSTKTTKILKINTFFAFV